MPDNLLVQELSAGQPTTRPIVRMTGIGKRFGPVRVLQDAALDIFPGELHVLAGENGAGKSTFIKILAGVYQDYEGSIEIDGKPVRPRSPQEAVALGIAVIHQELSLVPSMSVADNLFLGHPPTRAGFVDNAGQQARTRVLLEQFGIDARPGQGVEELPVGSRQLIEIAKALGRNTRVIVMDEPTSALSRPEAERLFRLIDSLKKRNCGIVYITHRMEEIERLADRITVLRDGHVVGSEPAVELPPAKLIRLMVGRDVEARYERQTPPRGSERLRLETVRIQPGGLGTRPAADRVNLSVRAGEILGLGGLQGSGASELLLGLFGAYGTATQGRLFLDGVPYRPLSPRHAIERGVALVTNDRKASGLILPMTIAANMTLAGLPALSPGGWRSPAREQAAAARHAHTLSLKSASLDQAAGELSGGNQQKVVLAKWLQIKPRLLLLDEPTRGIDVGAKQEIYRLMDRWTADGIAILLITSELQELLAMSDRIAVLHRGRVTAELARPDFSPDAVLAAAMGRNGERSAA